ncbi:MAG TPA: orotidine-5'-phosphate decarboxylase [Candidatus Acidoferrales bacterium]|nr:orotidine-5'-phosphate decarboxylase [Candidatus Acidoferrales bacterium]
MNDARERLIVALDVASAVDAQQLVATLGESVIFYKVGKQLFTAEGPRVVRELVESGRKVFLDLKFHDIPNTVAGAVQSAAQLGVSMLTVHASGGTAMLRAAVESAAKSATPPLILGVTVLTSIDKAALEETGVSGTVQSQVLRLAELALNAGCGGIVASAQEAAEIRRELGAGFAIVTPGIRPAGGEVGDQARVVTPTAALKAGATHLVVGRPITAAALPAQAVQQILQEMNEACASRPS